VIPNDDDTQGWNRYSYCRNNPVRYKDPTGHFENTGFTTSVTAENEDVHNISVAMGKVEEKDTLWSIAKDQLEKEMEPQKVDNKTISKRVSSIKVINGLKSNTIKPGQTLITGLKDKNFGPEGARQDSLIMDVCLLFTGIPVAQKITKEYAGAVTAEVMAKKSGSYLLLRESGKFTEKNVPNLVKGLIAGDMKSKAAAASELVQNIAATKVGRKIGEFTLGGGGVAEALGSAVSDSGNPSDIPQSKVGLAAKMIESGSGIFDRIAKIREKQK
jgi:LysM repeat protein